MAFLTLSITPSLLFHSDSLPLLLLASLLFHSQLLFGVQFELDGSESPELEESQLLF
jgi:hypothetical protein